MDGWQDSRTFHVTVLQTVFCLFFSSSVAAFQETNTCCESHSTCSKTSAYDNLYQQSQDGVPSLEVVGVPMIHSLGDQEPPRHVTPGSLYFVEHEAVNIRRAFACPLPLSSWMWPGCQIFIQTTHLQLKSQQHPYRSGRAESSPTPCLTVQPTNKRVTHSCDTAKLVAVQCRHLRDMWGHSTGGPTTEDEQNRLLDMVNLPGASSGP